MEQKNKSEETVNIVVELEPSMNRFQPPEGKEAQAFRSNLLQYLNDLTADLTIPANISLTIAHIKERRRSTMTSYRVKINGRNCRLPIPSLVPQDVLAVELARSVAREIYKNAELLVTLSLAERIKEQWASENEENCVLDSVSSNQFHKLLVEFVRRYFSISRAKAFSQVLRKWQEAGVTIAWDARRDFEECIFDWSVLKLGILVPQDSFSEASEGQRPTGMTKIEDKFEMMEDGLFYELGVMVPKVMISIDEKLKEDEFRIQINDLKFPAIHGIRQSHFMVNDTVDRLSLIKIIGKPTTNPANESECAIVQDEKNAREICEEAGLFIWTPEEFIVLALSAEFRRNAEAFLTEEIVRHSLSQLQLAFPALIDTVERSYSTPELTGILRDLLEEGISIRNLPGILEALLSIHALMPTKPDSKSVIVDNIRQNVKPQIDRNKTIEKLRITLKRYISTKHAKDGKTLIVFLLDPEIEMRITNTEGRGLGMGDEDHDRLVSAIFDELGDSSLASQNAVILTTLETRKKLRKLIEKEFPRLAVLCYQELDLDLNIQPVSRISLHRETKQVLYHD